MLIDPSGNPSLAFTLFAAECEGELDTYQGKINKIIKNLRQRSCWEMRLLQYRAGLPASI